MIASSQKARERYYISQVQELGALPAGEITDSESPDALIKTPDGVVGIEVTEYIRGQSDDQGMRRGGSPFRAGETAADRFAFTARQIYEQKYSVPLWVSFHWYGKLLPKQRADTTALVSELVDLVARFTPKLGHSRVRIPDAAFEETELRKYLYSPYVGRVPRVEQAAWTVTQAGFVGVDPNEIQALVTEKDGKLSNYRQKCDTVYLLIVADGWYLSSDPGDAHRLAGNVFAGGFDRVVFYYRAGDGVVDLTCE